MRFSELEVTSLWRKATIRSESRIGIPGPLCYVHSGLLQERWALASLRRGHPKSIRITSKLWSNCSKHAMTVPCFVSETAPYGRLRLVITFAVFGSAAPPRNLRPTMVSGQRKWRPSPFPRFQPLFDPNCIRMAR
jgi:hypothetical protein